MTPEPAPEIDEDNSEAMAAFEKLTPEQQAEFLAAIDEGIADIEAGRWVSSEEVLRWVLSLGTDNELPAPEC
jgi:predicted transcriptional regulator